MKKQTIKSAASFTAVLIILSIIPSGAFALEDETSTDQINTANESKFGKMMLGGMRHWNAGSGGILVMGFGPAENITEENFTEIQAEMLNSITEKIAELQNMYNNVSEASTAEELQEVLLTQRQANIGNMPGEKNGFRVRVGTCGPCFFKAGDITEENFSDVQAEMLDSLENMTESLEEMQAKLTEAGEEDRAEELNEKITEFKNLYTDVSEASTAAELEEIIFSYLQTQAITSLEKEIEFLNARITEDGNATDEKLEERITELTALIADIEGAESLDELREIMSSEMKSGKGPMQEGKILMKQGGRGNMSGRPDSVQNNSTEV